MRCRLVAYRRVSTQKQGDSGLGLEAQDKVIADMARPMGCTVVATYDEVETGKRSDRPELLKALAECRLRKATLVIAKLDRLARNARFLLTLIESGVDVLFCDFPNIPAGATGKFMLTLMAAQAELEAGLTSERTKAALAAYKARGGILGATRPECRNLDDEARQRGAEAAGEASRRAADDAYAHLLPTMQAMAAEGLGPVAIAKRLNDAGHQTRQQKPWNRIQVKRVLDRAAKGG